MGKLNSVLSISIETKLIRDKNRIMWSKYKSDDAFSMNQQVSIGQLYVWPDYYPKIVLHNDALLFQNARAKH